ncbi:Putative ribonuclease H protein At1g65750 [Linum perenne]
MISFSSPKQLSTKLESSESAWIGSARHQGKLSARRNQLSSVRRTPAGRPACSFRSFWECPLTQDLGRYLGVPILHEKVTSHTYQDILDRIDKKLAGWKVKTLSLVGRVTFAQSVLAAIPAYAMQTLVLPVNMCEEIDRRIRNFVWGTTAEERKISLVSWEKICVPKEKGGLGLQMARQLNRAYLTKLAFIFFKEKDRLWVRLIQGKYFSDSNDGLTRRNLRSTSPPWKGIIKERDTMLEGAKSVIRDGRETSFWTDCWIDAGLRLIDFADTTDPEFEINSTVADMVTEEGEWNFSLIEMFLQPEYTDLVAGMPPPRRNSGDDDWIWGCESSGRFTIKSAYNIICNSEELPSRSIWRSIWRWSGPNRIRHFLWLAAKDRLLTNAMRARRGMSQDAGCTFCNAGRSRRHTSFAIVRLEVRSGAS